MEVRRLTGEAAMRRRLEDIGLTEGSRVTCLMKSPLGDPKAYRIQGAVIALRDRDAATVFGVPITPSPHDVENGRRGRRWR